MIIRWLKVKNARAKTLNRPTTQAAPFLAHLNELKRRLFYIVASVFVGGGVAYAFEHHIVDVLLKPAGDQQFIYTSVGGGMDFLFKVAIYAGVIASIPVIVYQVLKFIEPVVAVDSNRFIAKITVISALLAFAGILFGYFMGLPNALHFLLHQFTTVQIKPLVTIQAYMSFVMMYMVGSALLLQAPLLLIFINRIKPLKPQKLMAANRWVILIAFIGAFIMNPTPNLIAQCFVAVPIILAWFVGVGLVWFINKKSLRPSHVMELIEKDLATQQERLRKLEQAISLTTIAQPELVPAFEPYSAAFEKPSTTQIQAKAARPKVVTEAQVQPDVSRQALRTAVADVAPAVVQGQGTNAVRQAYAIAGGRQIRRRVIS